MRAFPYGCRERLPSTRPAGCRQERVTWVARGPGWMPFVTVLFLFAVSVIEPAHAQKMSNERISEAIRLERTIKRRYLELIRIMHEVAKQLAKADPDTAVAIETAAQRAEEALIADDMDRVVQMLQSGLILPADATQGKIVERLRHVLKALQGGDELEWLLFMTEMIKEQRERLVLLVGRQRELEMHSRAVFKGEEMLAELKVLRPKVEPLAERQKKLLSAMDEVPESELSLRFAAARGEIGELAGRMADVGGQLNKAYPSPDDMINNATAARQMERSASEMRASVRTVLNEPDILEFVKREKVQGRSAELMEHIDAVVSELGKAAKAFDGNRLDEALLAVAECAHRLKEAQQTFGLITESDPQARALKKVLAEQEALSKDFAEIRPLVEKTVPRDLSVDLPSAGLVDYELGKSSVEKTRGMTAEEYQEMLSAAMRRAIENYDLPGARQQQEQTLNMLGDLVARLDDAAADIREWHTSPRFPIQKMDEEGIVKDLRHVLERYSSLSEAAGGAEKTPLAMTGELRSSMAGAADLAVKAAALLGDEKAEPANSAQLEVIRLLTKIVEDLENMNTYDIGGFIEDFLDYWNALLQRMLLKQKMCIEETKNVWKKRRPEGSEERFARAQQLQIRTIARTQDGMQDDVWQMRRALNAVVAVANNTATTSGGAKNAPMPVSRYGEKPNETLTERAMGASLGKKASVFGMFIALIEIELDNVVKKLEAFDPGLDTQKRQELVKSHLEAMAGIGLEEPDEDDLNAAQSMASNNFMIGPKPPDESRKAVMRLMISLQEQINYRTQQLDEIKRAGKWNKDHEKEAERLQEMQTMVHGNIVQFALKDAAWWNLTGQGRGIGRGGL